MPNEKNADRGQAGRDNAREQGGKAYGPGGNPVRGEDSGEAEVQAKFDEANEKGYFGEVPPGPPNEAYSLETGPDSPNALDEAAAAAEPAATTEK